MKNTFKNPAGRGVPGLLATGLLLAILLAGCGQSGPLFLPEDAPPADAGGEQAEPPAEEEDAETP